MEEEGGEIEFLSKNVGEGGGRERKVHFHLIIFNLGIHGKMENTDQGGVF